MTMKISKKINEKSTFYALKINAYRKNAPIYSGSCVVNGKVTCIKYYW